MLRRVCIDGLVHEVIDIVALNAYRTWCARSIRLYERAAPDEATTCVQCVTFASSPSSAFLASHGFSGEQK